MISCISIKVSHFHYLCIKIITEQHSGKNGDGDNDERVQMELETLGYKKSNIVPEICGWVNTCRNRLWWPDDETEAAAMAVVGKDFDYRKVGQELPFFTFDLPEELGGRRKG